jgi:hypothetical protein
MPDHNLIGWLIILLVILLLFGNRRIKPRRPPTHPLPVTGPIETSRISRSEEKNWSLLVLTRFRFGLRLRG